MHINAHIRCICNSQQLETPKFLSRDEWINKLAYNHTMNTIQQYKRINYWSNNMDETQYKYAEWQSLFFYY